MFDSVSTVNVVGARDLPRVLECSKIRAGPVNNGSWRVSRVGTKKKRKRKEKKRKKKGKGGEKKSDVGRINLNAVLLARRDGDVAVIE